MGMANEKFGSLAFNLLTCCENETEKEKSYCIQLENKNEVSSP
jgi:hypothetical protein